jgi:hypothetical protein
MTVAVSARARELACALALAGAVLLSGCGPTYAESSPAAKAVDAALRTRTSLSKDVSAYAPFFESSEVATELAAAAKADTTGASPVPGWDAPYVSALTSSTADVVVVWHRAGKYSSWPVATVFSMKRRDGRWVIADAADVTGMPPSPLKEK